MNIVLENAGTFFLIIFLGYIFKAKHILKKEDSKKIAKIVLNITLPCALLSSVSKLEVGPTMFLLILAGICFNVIMLSIGYIMAKKRDKETQAAHMLNVSGYNIGNFAIPFAQYFYPGAGIAYISMFDIGNAFMGLGLTYSIASSVVNRKEKFSIKEIIKKLVSSVAFDTYMFIFLISILNIEIPKFIQDITFRIGSANTFLSMFTVGLLLDFKINRNEIKDVINIIITRNLMAVILAIIVWFYMPIPDLAKRMLMICLFAPTTSISPIFSLKCGYKKDMPAMVGSISILISIITMSILMAY
ncbi:AEC family transporter [Clostridium sp. AL.422]|uniref:AEC family transporter n=1 Tax=Clostridium TaxID=1485 RepID=UPI00293DBF14|nr:MULTISPECIES: AEC family transporter [unclassified Clostridium]MDV4150470.1 AEC family transporter [Clostridium sp. AL.422]